MIPKHAFGLMFTMKLKSSEFKDNLKTQRVIFFSNFYKKLSFTEIHQRQAALIVPLHHGAEITRFTITHESDHVYQNHG